MEIEIIPLALKKMKQRELTRDMINDVVNSPEQIIEGYGGRKVRQKRYTDIWNNKGLIRVVCENEGDEKITVITAYFTTKIERYWEG